MKTEQVRGDEIEVEVQPDGTLKGKVVKKTEQVWDEKSHTWSTVPIEEKKETPKKKAKKKK